MNPMLEAMRRRREVIDKLGPEEAWDWFVAQTKTPGTPSWSHQEEAADKVLTEKIRASWRGMGAASTSGR